MKKRFDYICSHRTKIVTSCILLHKKNKSFVKLVVFKIAIIYIFFNQLILYASNYWSTFIYKLSYNHCTLTILILEFLLTKDWIYYLFKFILVKHNSVNCSFYIFHIDKKKPVHHKFIWPQSLRHLLYHLAIRNFYAKEKRMASKNLIN